MYPRETNTPTILRTFFFFASSWGLTHLLEGKKPTARSHSRVLRFHRHHPFWRFENLSCWSLEFVSADSRQPSQAHRQRCSADPQLYQPCLEGVSTKLHALSRGSPNLANSTMDNPGVKRSARVPSVCLTMFFILQNVQVRTHHVIHL